MAVYPPGFSERVFEFSFNAEYAAANKAILAGAPHIPTQNEENYLGYDVAFAISAAGGIVNTLALQHKVARRVDNVTGSNAHFSWTAGIPYFAFRLDVEQFNVIESIASADLVGIDFFYCVPLFTTTVAMDGHYIGNSVASNAIWIDVAGVGPLITSEPHSIVYSESGTAAWVFSKDPKPLKVQKVRLEGARDRHRTPLKQQSLRAIYEFIYPRATEYWSRRRKEPKISGQELMTLPEAPPTYKAPTQAQFEATAIRDLLSNYLGMSVLFEVPF